MPMLPNPLDDYMLRMLYRMGVFNQTPTSALPAATRYLPPAEKLGISSFYPAPQALGTSPWPGTPVKFPRFDTPLTWFRGYPQQGGYATGQHYNRPLTFWGLRPEETRGGGGGEAEESPTRATPKRTQKSTRSPWEPNLGFNT